MSASISREKMLESGASVSATVLVPLVEVRGRDLMIMRANGQWIGSSSSVTSEGKEFEYITHSFQAIKLLKELGAKIETVVADSPYKEIEQRVMEATDIDFLGHKCDAIFQRVMEFKPKQEEDDSKPDTITVYACLIKPAGPSDVNLPPGNLKFVDMTEVLKTRVLGDLAKDYNSRTILEGIVTMFAKPERESRSLLRTGAAVIGVAALCLLIGKKFR